MKVIGIAGKARSGKNTAAGMLAGMLVDLGYTVRMDAFAVGIKQHLKKEGWTPGDKSAKWRKRMQESGTFFRKLGPAFWIDSLCNRVGWYGASAHVCNDSQWLPDFLIISDVRFRNEAEWVKRFGQLWLIEGRGGLAGELGEHASETGVDDLRDMAEAVFCNSGSLEDMAILVRQMVSIWLEVWRAE